MPKKTNTTLWVLLGITLAGLACATGLLLLVANATTDVMLLVILLTLVSIGLTSAGILGLLVYAIWSFLTKKKQTHSSHT